MSDDARSLAIACCSGGFKGIFGHGILSALEAAGISAAAYAAASSSVFPAMCAAIGQAGEIGLRYWRSAIHTLHQPGNGMSEVVLHSIAEARHLLRESLFQPGRPRFLIATSAVKTQEAAELTQGDGARRLGRRLLLQAARGDRSWRDQHLESYIFDTAPGAQHRLTPDNIEAVTYASTRMLHAWSIPARVGDQPCIDAAYTCACPALELARLGYREVIAIATEPGPLYRDIFQSEPIPERLGDTIIHIIRPENDIATLGADFTSVTEEGMIAAYEYGQQVGSAFAHSFTKS
ncbi:MAG TPA: hypothetical protein VKV37_03620 [Ktedonobacteraceae bacterium]|jgi:hypothetical protein|nr:hypothetical protein [Ktedonobacteraceae bacterium]